MTKITQQISDATMQIKKGQKTKLHRKIFFVQKIRVTEYNSTSQLCD